MTTRRACLGILLVWGGFGEGILLVWGGHTPEPSPYHPLPIPGHLQTYSQGYLALAIYNSHFTHWGQHGEWGMGMDKIQVAIKIAVDQFDQ